ncbi:toxin, partial [Myxococcota bacterium]|nr:toxin [Myxococcota bacterium]
MRNAFIFPLCVQSHAAFEQEQLEEIYKKEYYAGDTQAYLLPDTAIPVGLSPQEQRDAYRALKGGVLRQEVYAEDDTPQQAHPFTVTESCAHVRLLQPTQDGFPAVFLVMPSESLQFHYERHPEDPRIHHEMTLEVDAYGQPIHTARISYPRRNPPVGMPEQAVLSVVTTEHTLIHADQQVGWYRLGIPQASRSYEVTGLSIQQWTPATLLQQLQAASTLSYEQTPTHGLVQKRLLSRTRALYAKDDQTGPLAEGQVESLALPYESYEQIFTSGLLQEVFDSKVDATLLQAAGYQWFDGVWWAASGRAVLDAQHFYHPIQEIDALGHTTTLSHDSEHLFPTQIVDALGNTTSAQINYRVLQPWEVTDPNGNRTQVAFDALGMTVASAVMGKSSETLGDTLVGVEPDLDPTTLAAFLSDPKLHSATLLGQATTRFVYDVTRYYLSGLPNVTAQIERETHVSELGQGETSRLFHSFVYADGSGGELMKKAQAEAGMAPKRDANGDLVFDGEGELVMEQASSRWVGSGATIYDNKGNPLKKYEPFFSSTHDFEPEEELRHWGVTSLMVYDALGRA